MRLGLRKQINQFGDSAPVPTITSITPALADNQGGTTVVITGTNFTGAPSVQFYDGATFTNAASYVVNSPTQITAVTPALAVGVYDLYVGAGSLVGAYTSWNPGVPAAPTVEWDTTVPYTRVTYSGHANTGVWPKRMGSLVVGGGNPPCWRSASDGVTADSPVAAGGAPVFDSAAAIANLLKTPENIDPASGNVATLNTLFGGLNNPTTVDGCIFYALDITSINSAGVDPYSGDCVFMEDNNRGQITLLKTPNRARFCWYDDSAGAFKTQEVALAAGTGRINILVQRKAGIIKITADGVTFSAGQATGSVNCISVVRAGVNINDGAGKLNGKVLANAWYNNFSPTLAQAKQFFDWAKAQYP